MKNAISQIEDSDLKNVLQEIWKSKTDFYRKKYSKAGVDVGQIEALDLSLFQSLPVLTRRELAETPYRERLYLEAVGNNKLLHCPEADRYFVVHRSLDEIKNYDLPFNGKRPMVIMGDVYEAVEHCLFFYERKILPLIGEVPNAEVIAATAKQYQVDTLFLDRYAVMNFKDDLVRQNLPLKKVVIIGKEFDRIDWDWPKEIELHFILSLPETGRIALSCPEAVRRGELVFHAYPDIFLEEGIAVLTSTLLRASPLIRYQSHFFVESFAPICRCDKLAFKAETVA